MSKLNKLGIKGEQLAKKFLEKKGHIILHTNLKIQYKEIDIISLHQSQLVFSEIKTRSSLFGGYPEEHITKSKINHLKTALHIYLNNNPQYTQARIDIISIIIKDNKTYDILHFEDAIY